jgi:hypothetical protein
MKTLIIYDTAGNLIKVVTGTYNVPVGIPYLEVEVPTGKQLKGVDTSVTPNVPIYEDIPKTDIEILQETVDALVLASLGV